MFSPYIYSNDFICIEKPSMNSITFVVFFFLLPLPYPKVFEFSHISGVNLIEKGGGGGHLTHMSPTVATFMNNDENKIIQK